MSSLEESINDTIRGDDPTATIKGSGRFSPTGLPPEDELRVIKRDGSIENLSFDKILKRVKCLGTETKPNLTVNYSQLVMKVVDQLYNNMPTYVIDELTAEQCASLTTKHLDYGTLASRIIVSNNHKTTTADFAEAMDLLYQFRDVHGNRKPLIHVDAWYISQINKEFFQSILDYSRDYLFDYFGFKTLERAYLIKIGKKIIERPQHMWLRVAIGIHGADLLHVKETYDLLSQKYFTHATPTLFNAGTNHPQLSSCYLIGMSGDSIEGIYSTLKDCAKISKWAGGIGLHVHNIRAAGTHINGTNGISNGLVPMLRVFNMTARYVDQGGGRRNGSFAIYLEPWHADVEDFLDMKKNHGDEEMRARDLFYALWIPDLFMEKVKNDEDWSLFCPHKCPGLADCYGNNFKVLYEKYCAEGKANKTIKARTLWFKILDSQMETGTPYILYKDAANRKSNQQNLGVIKSSNLCVAPETQILTDKGYFDIKILEGKTVNVWNGEEFSETVIHKTGVNQELMTIETSDGCSLDCTPYHKFYIQNNYDKKTVETIEAQNLKENDKLIKCNFPIIDGKNDIKYPYTHGFFCGDGTYSQPKIEKKHDCNNLALLHESYCKRHIDFSVSENNENLEKQTINSSIKCCGTSYEKNPIVALYGDKKLLLNYLDYRSVGNADATGRLNVSLPLDIESKFYVPSNASIKNKMEWFSGYCDADGSIAKNGTNESLQISSIEREFIINVKLMLQTCGINPKVTLMHNGGNRMLPDSNRVLKEYMCKSLYRLLISSVDLQKLVNLGFYPKRLKIIMNNTPNRDARKFVSIKKIIRTGRIDDTYCFNETKKHAGIFNGIITSQCTEILEYSDDEQTAVCNLASIGLTKFVRSEDKTFDYEKLHAVTKVVAFNLNRVIDVNFYPTEKTRLSNLLHRPIGIGIQGLADVFTMMNLSFTCDEAKTINKLIFETIYHASLECSMEIAKDRNCDMQLLAMNQQYVFEKVDVPNLHLFSKLETASREYTDKAINDELVQQLLPIPAEFYYLNDEQMGAYSSFVGSPAYKGILQFDMWPGHEHVRPENRYNCPVYDWNKLKEQIQIYGLRNSLSVAPMPTASTSQILGNNECFEPFTSNLYSRRTNAGEFVLPNKYLMTELLELGLWNETVKDNIILNKGSVQQLQGIPIHLKEKYKTVWEIPMKHLIDMAADRGPYICQSQSLNLWLEDPDYKTLTSMHFYSWQAGLKTGIYYLRRKAKHQAQQFTIAPPQQKQSTTEDIGCEMCSS